VEVRAVRGQGGAVQVDCIKIRVESTPAFSALELKYDKPLSSFAFNLYLRRYNKVDAVKRACFKQLPHTLAVHLKRFEFDYETMQRLKVKSRFEFPMELDMTPFTAEGIERDAAAAAAGSEVRPARYDKVG
jgi:hypothetical protein